MKHEDGTKTYVSPEKQAELLVEEKIKKSEAKASLENEKMIRRKSRRGGGGGGGERPEQDSDSDSAYEIPIAAGNPFCFVKPKSCGDLDKMHCVAPSASFKRNSSFSCTEENFGENSEVINLPPFIKPLETSVTFPSAQKRIKEKKKKNSNGGAADKKKDDTMKPDFSPPKEKIDKRNDLTEFNEIGRDEVDSRKIFFARSRRSVPVNDKSRKKPKNYKPLLSETEVKDTVAKENSFKLSKNRFSLPWGREKEKVENVEEEKTKSESELIENSKYFPEHEEVDFAKSFALNPFAKSSFENPEKFEAKELEGDLSKRRKEKVIYENAKNSKIAPENKSSLLDLIDKKMAEDLSEPEEVFFEENNLKADNKFAIKGFIPTVKSGKYKNELENENLQTSADSNVHDTPKRSSFRFSFPRYPDNLSKAQVRKSRNQKKIDPNPLKKMFGIRNIQKMQKNNLEDGRPPQPSNDDDKPGNEEEESFDKPTTEAESPNSLTVSDTKLRPASFLTVEKNFNPTNCLPEPKVNIETDTTLHELTHENGNFNLTRKRQFEIPTGRRDCRSDTESADHGSADKSSMSKLTTEKQSRNLISGLLEPFKKTRTKDRVVDADLNRSLPSLEITVKEQPEEVHMNGAPKTEGIVYAELDMARPGGNLMRRDEGEKTEYAEIIYPSNKLTPERAMEELRKSRENLVSSSRENLAEVEEAFTTTITPDGKKEAAV